MAHFFGAVSEMRTSGLMPSWLGSSTSQPEGDGERKKEALKERRAVIIFCLLCSHSAGDVFRVWWAHTELTVAWDLSSMCASRFGKRLPGSQCSEEDAWRPIYHVVSLSLRALFLQCVRNTYLRARPHWQWGSWFASGLPEYQSRAP